MTEYDNLSHWQDLAYAAKYDNDKLEYYFSFFICEPKPGEMS
jgi:hypothetical protein